MLAGKVAAAAEARWLTRGTVTSAAPLLVEVDGAIVPAGLVGTAPLVGDDVLIGVLRGSPAVGYVVLGTVVPPAPSTANYAWIITDDPPQALSAADQVFVPTPWGGSSYARYQQIQVSEELPTDPAGVLHIYVGVQYPPDPTDLDPTTLDIWLEAPDASLYPLWHGDSDPNWPAGSSDLEVSVDVTYTGSPVGYWQVWVAENPAFTESGAILHNFALAFTRVGGLPI